MTPLNPLNPAAGDVPVPEDQREIDAAERAGRISCRVFPYIAWRYGERGRQFTRSDSAWLAWLTRFDQERVDQQIAWLRDVLSNRGMPSWVLEVHLRVLQRQLERAAPMQQAKYQSLGVSADGLRAARQQQISAPRQQQLAADFAAALKRSSSRLISGAAKLIVAAVADEQLGVKNAVSSLAPWLTDLAQLRESARDSRRLSAADRRALDSPNLENRWTSAIEATIDRARSGR